MSVAKIDPAIGFSLAAVAVIAVEQRGDFYGFARKTEYEFVEQTESSLAFRLAASDVTLAQYPWNFCLLLTYTLDGDQLTISSYREEISQTYTVKELTDNHLVFEGEYIGETFNPGSLYHWDLTK